MPLSSVGNVMLEFDDSEQVYSTLDVIRGSVILDLKRGKEVSRVLVCLRGECVVKVPSSASNVKIDSQETLINTTEVLLEGNINLEGQRTYDFALNLPTDLPSSFDIGHARVSYICTAVVEYGGLNSFLSDCVNRKITLVQPQDINHEDLSFYRNPAESKLKRKVSSIHHVKTPGFVHVLCRLSRCAFTRGESVEINAVVHNKTKISVGGTTASIVREVTCWKRKPHDAGRSAALKSTIVKTKRPKIAAGETDVWESVSLNLPSTPDVPPSGSRKSSLVDISYKFVFRVKVPGSSDMICQCPIVIGTHREGSTDLYSIPRPRKIEVLDIPYAKPHSDEVSDQFLEMTHRLAEDEYIERGEYYHEDDVDEEVTVKPHKELTYVDEEVIVKPHKELTYVDEEVTVKPHKELTYVEEEVIVKPHNELTYVDEDVTVKPQEQLTSL